mmetsp:Transcript_49561/g.101175  ORF Transcript_49561/g.101175 Transcript_49561/m.101175 type:complete len:249 (-) Transcript_49561:75-821(-)|eukprot:CAMPEP_0181325486 /NCGR_PEP_ID=MMETSP1101-20121128/20956_1 /TAXON_ID=46948 /ORGANISM="Rhodomonas abbreviata, Strain Caron Lab Isolate" /LENGTH=248 /DNA_ID=CAMNT_0023433807 /DNA_START=69 /DNA_END=815 /DNA_ORIENTATION=-
MTLDNFAPFKKQRTAADAGFVSFAAHRTSMPATAPANKTADVKDDENNVFPAFLPRDVYQAAVQELSQGGKQTLEKCLSLWRSGRLTSEMLDSFVQSIAWQSHSLMGHSKKCAVIEEEPCDLLCDDELMELKMFGTSPPATPTSGNTPCSTPRNITPTRKRSFVEVDLDQTDIQSALDIVNCTTLLDSTKTSKLTVLLQICPRLSPFFSNNGWSRAANRFTSAPEWTKAQIALGSAMRYTPQKADVTF